MKVIIAVHLNNSPELSQRLFGVNKPPPPPPLPTSTAQTIFSSASTQIIQTTTNLTPVQQPVLNSSVSAAQIVAQLTSTMPQKQNISPASTQVLETLDPATHLPTALGLKIRSHPISHANQQQNKINNNINSTTTLLQQQLRGESLLSNSNCNSSSNGSNSNNTNENNSHTNISNSNNNNNNNNSNNNSNNISNNNNNNNNNNTNNNNINNNSNNSNNNSTANTKNPSAQSIEQSSNQQKEKHQCNSESSMLQPPSSNNLRHQFLLHMATNPIVKTEYLLKNDSNNDENVMPVDVPSPPLNNNAQIVKSELDGNASTIIDLVPSPPATNDTTTISHQAQVKDDSSPITPRNPRPIQRRRIRRKAQSTVDDQAEHLTEMSVRGLDLFRYASITEGVYQCTECAKENVQKTFKNKYSFQRHAFLYHEGKHRKVFPCPVCGKEFSRPDKMKNHLKMTHEGFVPKDVNYHPLNYLITAATAGEIQHLFHQMDQRTSPVRDINSTTLDGGNTTITQHPPSLPPPPLIKLKNEIHTIRHVHESSSSPPPLGAHEGSIIPTPQEEVK